MAFAYPVAFWQQQNQAPVNPSTDPYFGSVVLLLHGDGSNGSTAITDSSSFAHTVTPVGAAQITTANKKFGTGSISFDGGNGTYLSLDSTFTANFKPFANKKRTIEAQVKFLDENYRGIIGAYEATPVNGRWLVLTRKNNNGYLDLRFLWTTGTGSETYVETKQPHINEFNHIAVCVDATTPTNTKVWLGINGVITSFTGLDFSTQTVSYDRVRVGGDLSVYIPPFYGQIDEIRITGDVCRYTTNSYLVPTEAFPNS